MHRDADMKDADLHHKSQEFIVNKVLQNAELRRAGLFMLCTQQRRYRRVVYFALKTKFSKVKGKK